MMSAPMDLESVDLLVARAPTLAGKLEVEFTVGTAGKVMVAKDASDRPFPGAEVTACVLTRFKGLRFPKPEGGAVSITYPFVFKAAK